MATIHAQVKGFGISVGMLSMWMQTYPAAHIEACVQDFLDKVKKGKLKTTESSQQGGYLRSLIEKADFSAKQKAVEAREIKIKKQVVDIEAETVRQDLKKQEVERQIQKEQAIVNAIFAEQTDLEQSLFDDINRREGSGYTPADYGKYPFLRSKILILLKKQFGDRF